jgi:protein gp37
MAERTAIAWAHGTANFWIGCTKLDSPSPAGSACRSCYAAALSKRTGRRDTNRRDLWDPRADRVRTSPTYWAGIERWNRDAAAAGEVRRIFTLSLGDFWDNRVPPSWRAEALDLMRRCTSLHWLVLTKRPQNIARMLPPWWGDGPRNIVLGVTVENQLEADRRLPALLAVPSAGGRFVSAEPLLEAVDFRPYLHGIQQIIVGGESGPRARPSKLAWFRDVCAQCDDAPTPVAFFMKQLGSNRQEHPDATGHGTDPAQWPYDLRRQEFPA